MGVTRGIANNGDYNIVMDTSLNNASISASSSLFSRSQTPIFLKALDLAELEQLVQFGRLKWSTTGPTKYAQLNDPWNQRLRDKNQAKASIKPKRGFAIHACKINVRSDTPQNYQKAIQYAEKN